MFISKCRNKLTNCFCGSVLEYWLAIINIVYLEGVLVDDQLNCSLSRLYLYPSSLQERDLPGSTLKGVVNFSIENNHYEAKLNISEDPEAAPLAGWFIGRATILAYLHPNKCIFSNPFCRE